MDLVAVGGFGAAGSVVGTDGVFSGLLALRSVGAFAGVSGGGAGTGLARVTATGGAITGDDGSAGTLVTSTCATDAGSAALGIADTAAAGGSCARPTARGACPAMDARTATMPPPPSRRSAPTIATTSALKPLECAGDRDVVAIGGNGGTRSLTTPTLVENRTCIG